MIEQPPKTRLCGQVAVANLLGITLAESVAAFGHHHGTKTREIAAALVKLGYLVPRLKLVKTPTLPLPSLAIGKMRWRSKYRPGKLRGWHWVAIIHGKVIDGMKHETRGEVTSCLVVFPKGWGQSNECI